MSEISIDQLKDFFERPGINKAGICREMQITQQYLNRVLDGTNPLTDKLKAKLLPMIKSYGFGLAEKAT